MGKGGYFIKMEGHCSWSFRIGPHARWGTSASPGLPVQALSGRFGTSHVLLEADIGNIMVHLVPVYKWGD